MLSELEDVTKATSYQRKFLRRRADKLIEELENKKPPTILIPQCLLPTAKVPKAAAVGATVSQPGTDASRKERKRARESEGAETREAHVNPEAQPDWAIPEGKTYGSFFPRASPNQTDWPRMTEIRHATMRSMCVRFQAKGQCTVKFSLAQVPRSKMTDKEEVGIAARFKKIYGK
jgi:hypothetical protein